MSGTEVRGSAMPTLEQLMGLQQKGVPLSPGSKPPGGEQGHGAEDPGSTFFGYTRKELNTQHSPLQGMLPEYAEKSNGVVETLLKAPISVLKGAVKGLCGMVKSLFTPEGLLLLAASAALIIVTGGAATPFIAAAGIAIAGVGAANSVLNVGETLAHAVKTGDYKAFQAAMEDLGENGVYLAAALYGGKAAKAHVETSGETVFGSRLLGDVLGKNEVQSIGGKPPGANGNIYQVAWENTKKTVTETPENWKAMDPQRQALTAAREDLKPFQEAKSKGKIKPQTDADLLAIDKAEEGLLNAKTALDDANTQLTAAQTKKAGIDQAAHPRDFQLAELAERRAQRVVDQKQKLFEAQERRLKGLEARDTYQDHYEVIDKDGTYNFYDEGSFKTELKNQQDAVNAAREEASWVKALPDHLKTQDAQGNTRFNWGLKQSVGIPALSNSENRTKFVSYMEMPQGMPSYMALDEHR